MFKNLKRISSKIVWLLVALLMTVQLFPLTLKTASAQKETQTLKVAFPYTEGITEFTEDGKYSGMLVDYLNEISNYTGWKYEYIIPENASIMLNDFMAGKYDLMGGVYYMEFLEEYYGYPKYHTGYARSVLLARWEDETIKSFDLNTFNGKTIGVYEKANENIRRLEQFLIMNNLDCTLRRFSYQDMYEEENLYKYLSDGTVDMLLGNSSEVGKMFRGVASFNSQPFYIVTQPNATEYLAQLNNALEKIYESDPNFADNCYEANFPDIVSANIKLNNDELSYIQKNPVVRIAVPKDVYPVSSVSQNNEHKGILPDVLSKIAENTGLKIEYVQADTYTQTIEMVTSGQAEVLSFFSDDQKTADEQNLAMSKAYASLSRTLVRNKKVSYPSEGLTIALVEGRQLPEEIAAKIVYYPDMPSALRAVNSGKADLACGISAQIEREIQEERFTNLVPVALVAGKETLNFAVTKPADTQLFTILNKAIGMIGAKDLEAIVNRNIESIGVGNYNFTDFIYANPFMFLTIMCALLLLIVAIIVIVSLFRVRSANMELALEKADADNRAKSEFLSRMSHEIRTPMNAVIGLTDLTTMQEGVPEPVRENLFKIRSSAHYLISLLNDILDMSRIGSGMLTIEKAPFSLSRMLDEMTSMMTAEAQRRGITLSVVNETEGDTFAGDCIRLRQVLTNLVSNAVKFTPAGGKVDVRVKSGQGDLVSFYVTDTGEGIAQEDCERIFQAFEQVGNCYAKSQGTGLGLSISQSIVGFMGGKLQVNSTVGQGSEFYFTIPLEPAEEVAAPRLAEDNGYLIGMRVLMAEDNDLNAEIAQDILEIAGVVVTRVADGVQVVDEFSRNGENYDAILMDIQMPEMNGLDATRKIRELHTPYAAAIPIIAMTANTFQEDSDAAIAAGMNFFVSKPIDINILYNALREAKK